ncbi:MAG: hypothetical protein QNK23_11210 [Crocinitomicaceae bacterium]|nr:hypothetical protein [Crocinitomicaceae bacterium]
MNIILKSLLVVFLLFVFSSLRAQDTLCDEIYSFVDQEAEIGFINDSISANQYFIQEILPIVLSEREEFPIEWFKMVLLISDQGQVDRIILLRGGYSELVRSKLLANLKEMTKWEPALIAGEPVCSEFYFSVNCYVSE